jgi:hypothetical protein
MVFLIGQYVYKLKSDILRYVIYKGYSGPGTAYHSGAHSPQGLVMFVLLNLCCVLLFVLYHFSVGHCIVCPSGSDYAFDMFELFLAKYLRHVFACKNIYNVIANKGNNKITELRTIFQRESKNS